MNNIEFLQNWVKSNCNGDWEHNFGIKIETLDNPGWHIIFDLEDTEFEEIVYNINKSVSNEDWYFINTKNKQLIASGDVNKLPYLLEEIKKILSPPTGADMQHWHNGR